MHEKISIALKMRLRNLLLKISPKNRNQFETNSYADFKVARELHTKYSRYIESIEAGKIREVSLRNALPILLLERDSKIVDVGGELGSNFYIANKLKQSNIEKYGVVETSHFVNLAKSVENQTLRFFTSLSDALTWVQTPDLIIFGSTLQYLGSASKTVEDSILATPKYIYVSKTPMVEDSEGYHAYQETLLSNNGPIKGLTSTQSEIIVKNRVFILNRKRFEDMWTGYSVGFCIENDEKFYTEDGRTSKTFTYLLIRNF
jgi:putative methyltransferase (TIGR04325 family)